MNDQYPSVTVEADKVVVRIPDQKAAIATFSDERLIQEVQHGIQALGTIQQLVTRYIEAGATRLEALAAIGAEACADPLAVEALGEEVTQDPYKTALVLLDLGTVKFLQLLDEFVARQSSNYVDEHPLWDVATNESVAIAREQYGIRQVEGTLVLV